MKNYKKIVILTGAGISAESGIKTFRDANGLWEDHPIEEVATVQGYQKNPTLVLEFYNQRRKQLFSGKVQFNDAHKALSDLEREHSSTVLITQNVDNLHERAGSKNIFHMHGELCKIRCNHCQRVFYEEGEITLVSKCHECESIGRLRPHIVWFGEMPFYMDEIEKVLKDCDLFLAIGTSAVVYPAAGFVELAKSWGADCFEANLAPTAASHLFDKTFYGPATKVLPQLVSQLLGKE